MNLPINMNNGLNIILAFDTVVLASFVETPRKIVFLSRVKLHHRMAFKALDLLKSKPKHEPFPLGYKEKVRRS